MFQRLMGLLCVAVTLAAPVATHAAVVTWNFEGTIKEVSDANQSFLIPPAPGTEGISVGDSFKILVSFDTAATLSGSKSGTTGMQYLYAGGSLSEYVQVGKICPLNNSDPQCAPSGNSSSAIFLRDNYTYTPGPCPKSACDGLFFDLANNNVEVQLAFRGPVLDIFSGAGLPQTPDPRLMNSAFLMGLDFAGLNICVPDCGTTGHDYAAGVLTSITGVPEPATMGLLGIGFAASAMVRRRKKSQEVL